MALKTLFLDLGQARNHMQKIRFFPKPSHLFILLIVKATEAAQEEIIQATSHNINGNSPGKNRHFLTSKITTASLVIAATLVLLHVYHSQYEAKRRQREYELNEKKRGRNGWVTGGAYVPLHIDGNAARLSTATASTAGNNIDDDGKETKRSKNDKKPLSTSSSSRTTTHVAVDARAAIAQADKIRRAVRNHELHATSTLNVNEKSVAETNGEDRSTAVEQDKTFSGELDWMMIQTKRGIETVKEAVFTFVSNSSLFRGIYAEDKRSGGDDSFGSGDDLDMLLDDYKHDDNNGRKEYDHNNSNSTERWFRDKKHTPESSPSNSSNSENDTRTRASTTVRPVAAVTPPIFKTPTYKKNKQHITPKRNVTFTDHKGKGDLTQKFYYDKTASSASKIGEFSDERRANKTQPGSSIKNRGRDASSSNSRFQNTENTNGNADYQGEDIVTETQILTTNGTTSPTESLAYQGNKAVSSRSYDKENANPQFFRNYHENKKQETKIGSSINKKRPQESNDDINSPNSQSRRRRAGPFIPRTDNRRSTDNDDSNSHLRQQAFTPLSIRVAKRRRQANDLANRYSLEDGSRKSVASSLAVVNNHNSNKRSKVTSNDFEGTRQRGRLALTASSLHMFHSAKRAGGGLGSAMASTGITMSRRGVIGKLGQYKKAEEWIWKDMNTVRSAGEEKKEDNDRGMTKANNSVVGNSTTSATFNFGSTPAPSAPEQIKKSSDNGSDGVPKPSFTLGAPTEIKATSPNKKVSNNANSNVSKSTFVFGAPAMPSNTSLNNVDTKESKTGVDDESKLSFNFGTPVSAASATISTDDKESTASNDISKPSFTFGTAATTANSSNITDEKSSNPSVNVTTSSENDSTATSKLPASTSAASFSFGNESVPAHKINSLSTIPESKPTSSFEGPSTEIPDGASKDNSAPDPSEAKPMFSFGHSTSLTPSAANKTEMKQAPGPSTSSAASAPGFSFGKPTDQSTSLPSAAAAVSTPSFSFGNSAEVPSTNDSKSTPGFSFEQSSKLASTPSVAASATTPEFSFGNSSAPNPATSTVASSSTQGFSFGNSASASAAASTAAPVSATAFSFGNNSAPTPAPSTAAPTSTPSFSFGNSASTTAPVPPAPTPKIVPDFSFGNSASGSTPALSSAAPASTPGFSFGNNSAPTPAPSATSTSAPGFSFGNNSAPTPAPSSTSTSAPGFSFGNNSAPTPTPNTASTSAPGFSFGNNSAPTTAPSNTSTSTPSFSFGNNSAPTPAPSATSTSAPGFSFGNNSVPTPTPNTASTSTPSFSFGNSTAAAPTPAMSTTTSSTSSFTSTATTNFSSAAPAPSVAFGQPGVSSSFGNANSGFGAPAPAAGGFVIGGSSTRTTGPRRRKAGTRSRR